MVDAAACNQLVDEVLQILSAQSRQSACRNVDQLKVVWNVQAHVTSERVADLVELYVKKHLWSIGVKPLDKRSGRIHHHLRSPHCNGFGGR